MSRTAQDNQRGQCFCNLLLPEKSSLLFIKHLPLHPSATIAVNACYEKRAKHRLLLLFIKILSERAMNRQHSDKKKPVFKRNDGYQRSVICQCFLLPEPWHSLPCYHYVTPHNSYRAPYALISCRCIQWPSD